MLVSFKDVIVKSSSSLLINQRSRAKGGWVGKAEEHVG
jgi:hypothetical protein